MPCDVLCYAIVRESHDASANAIVAGAARACRRLATRPSRRFSPPRRPALRRGRPARECCRRSGCFRKLPSAGQICIGTPWVGISIVDSTWALMSAPGTTVQAKPRQNLPQRDPQHVERQRTADAQPRPGAKRMIGVRRRPQRQPAIGQKPVRLRVHLRQPMRDERREHDARAARQMERAKVDRLVVDSLRIGRGRQDPHAFLDHPLQQRRRLVAAHSRRRSVCRIPANVTRLVRLQFVPQVARITDGCSASRNNVHVSAWAVVMWAAANKHRGLADELFVREPALLVVGADQDREHVATDIARLAAIANHLQDRRFQPLGKREQLLVAIAERLRSAPAPRRRPRRSAKPSRRSCRPTDRPPPAHRARTASCS